MNNWKHDYDYSKNSITDDPLKVERDTFWKSVGDIGNWIAVILAAILIGISLGFALLTILRIIGS